MREEFGISLVYEARERIAGTVFRTPVLVNDEINADVAASVYFKCENLQKTGAFKARGATNAVFALSGAVAAAGVCTHSSGNHGAALARAAQLRGIPAYVVMPSNAAKIKQAAVRSFGGRISRCNPTLASREKAAAAITEETGATLIHGYDDWRVMAGQGTVALELTEDVPGLDIILCPVGGGGLLSGTAVVSRALARSAEVIGVEPSAVDTAYRSFKSGQRVTASKSDTVAEGLRTVLGERPFRVIQRHVDDIITVGEASILKAMRTLWDRLKLVIEPSGAVGYAAMLEYPAKFRGKRIGVILTGGNVDVDLLQWPGRT